jgi:hypothetical protein
VLAACCLLLPQLWLALHDVEHLLHAEDGELCEICVWSGNAGAPLPAASPLASPAPNACRVASVFAASPLAFGSDYRPQAARAPPALPLT